MSTVSNASWSITGWQLLASSVSQIAFVVLDMLYAGFHENQMNKKKGYYQFVITWVGRDKQPAKNGVVEIQAVYVPDLRVVVWLPSLLYVLQFIASAATMGASSLNFNLRQRPFELVCPSGTWVAKSYTHTIDSLVYFYIETISIAYVCGFYFYNWLRFFETRSYIWSLGALVDLFTSVPVVTEVCLHAVTRERTVFKYFSQACGITETTWLGAKCLLPCRDFP